MSIRTKLVKSTGRFGVRYGQSVRRKLRPIEKKQRQKQKCIFCQGQAKRVSKGIWQCKRCGKKFAGHAYYLEQAVEYQSKETTEQPESKPLKKSKTKENKK